MGKIEIGNINIFHINILPYIHFGPVAQRKYPEMFTHPFFAVKKVPEFRTLIFRIPLAEFIAVGKKSFLGPGFFFVTSSTAQVPHQI